MTEPYIVSRPFSEGDKPSYRQLPELLAWLEEHADPSYLIADWDGYRVSDLIADLRAMAEDYAAEELDAQVEADRW